MAQIATATAADPLGVPANTRIDRDPATGYLYALVRSTTANTWDLYRSTNGGTSWTLHLVLLRSGIQEMGSIFIANDGHLYLSYRTNESSQDRIYFRRCRLNNPVWGPETLTGNPANGGTAGSIHQGMDIQLVDTRGRYVYIVICVGTTFGGTSGITLYGVLLDQPAGTHRYYNGFLRGRRQWMDITGTGRVVPSVDIEHTGTGKSSPNPHLWIAYGRDVLRTVKLSWTGAGWSGPVTTQLLQSGLPVQDGISGRWDGQRWLMVVPHPTSTDTVQVVERDRGNTTSTLRQTPVHPAGVIRSLAVSYHGATATNSLGGVTILNRDIRVFAVGTANPDLHYVDYNRAAGTWTSWTTVTTTDVLGATPNQYSVRRGSFGNARQDLVIAHPPSPNPVTSYHQTLTYAPHTPEWDVPAIGIDNGAAANVSAPLNLVWKFSDPDPNDAQSAWALSRQIGNGTVKYYRTSDLTWQDTEQKNAGATPAAALMSMTMWDTFARTVSGGVGTSESGHAWVVDGPAAQFSVNGSAMVHALNALNTTLRARVSGVSYSDVDLSLQALLNVMPTGLYIRVESIVRWVDANNYYALRAHIQTSGAVDLQLIKVAAGVEQVLAGVASGVTHVAGLGLRFRVQMVGTALRGRVWRDGTTEPSTWQITTTDTAHAAGSIGVATLLPPGNTNTLPVNVLIDNVSVGVGGSAWASSTAEAAHTYRVKVWDSSDTASLYSDAFVVIPSGKVNPAITSPTPGQVLNQDRVTVSWTVAEQTQYRVWLQVVSAVVYDSGWRSGNDTSHTPDYALGDGFSYSAFVQTRNLEGQASDERQVNFSVQYEAPPVATLTATPQPALGVIRVAIASPTPVGSQPAVAHQDLYRRPMVKPFIVQHDFESADMSGWGPGHGGTAVRTNTRAKGGSWSYQLTADGTDPVAAYVQTALIPCTVGVNYILDMWMAGPVTRDTFAQLRWYDSGGVEIGASNGLSNPAPAADAWDYRWVAADAPSGATHMRLLAVVVFPAAGEVIWVDEVQVRESDRGPGVRVAAGLPANATYDDWGAVSGVAYEYRAETRSVIGTTVGGVWTP